VRSGEIGDRRLARCIPGRYSLCVETSSSSAETTPAIQDYLGAIYDLTGGDKPVIGARLARHMHVSAPSITEALKRMQREGYIRLARKKEIRLTSKGLSIAETMARRHRLLERWLTDVLGLDWSRAHDEAHRLEHALSPVVEERLAELLGMPSTCPHGNPIPGMPAPEAHNPVPLSQTVAGQALTVDRITEEAEADRQLLRFLWESGVRPGARLTIQEVAPYAGTISVILDGRTITMGLVASSKIWVYDPADPPADTPATRARTSRRRLRASAQPASASS
jgi:Mn-dependent DtxR family transcriptional regulator